MLTSLLRTSLWCFLGIGKPSFHSEGGTYLQGVFMQIHGLGVLIQGQAGIGKSALALELVSRGHKLIADDVVVLHRCTTKRIVGSCPAMLQDLLSVRGLGVLNIKSLFGRRAIKRKQSLDVILELVAANQVQQLDCLTIKKQAVPVLNVELAKLSLPLLAGCNITLWVEVALRNYALQLCAVNATEQLLTRQSEAMRAQVMQSESELHPCN